MPELPELEVVAEVLTRRLGGRRIEAVTLAARGAPIVVRDLTGEGFAAGLSGLTLGAVRRRGKFLIFEFPRSPLTLAVNPKLTGRFQLGPPSAKKAGPVHVTFHFADPDEQLRYVDSKRMGQLYLTRDTRRIPTFDQMGPEASEISLDDFRAGLKPYRGEIKGVLTRSAFRHRDRQCLCRRDPVARPAAPVPQAHPADARRGRPPLPGHAPDSGRGDRSRCAGRWATMSTSSRAISSPSTCAAASRARAAARPSPRSPPTRGSPRSAGRASRAGWCVGSSDATAPDVCRPRSVVD